eukprot:scaffold81590_cov25-Prasinocladus_malaysianus.AAC.2
MKWIRFWCGIGGATVFIGLDYGRCQMRSSILKSTAAQANPDESSSRQSLVHINSSPIRTLWFSDSDTEIANAGLYNERAL